MDLEKIKSAWSATDGTQQSLLNAVIISEMLNKKSERSLGKLIKYETLGICIFIVVIPVILFALSKNFSFRDYFLLSMLLLCVAGIVWYPCKIFVLSKIKMKEDFVKNLSNINKYQLLIKYEKIASVFITLFVIVGCIILYAQQHVPMFLWAFLLCMITVGIIISIYSYRQWYDKNIDTIKNCLAELRELKMDGDN